MGRMDPTSHIGMPNRVSNLEKTTLNNVGINVDFICGVSFQKRSRSCRGSLARLTNLMTESAAVASAH